MQDITPLEDARVDLPSLVSIRFWLKEKEESALERVQALSELFARKRGDTEVRFRLEKPRDFSVTMDVATKVRADREFRTAVEKICGPECMEVLAR